mgnify:FL=1
MRRQLADKNQAVVPNLSTITTDIDFIWHFYILTAIAEYVKKPYEKAE